MPACLLLMTPEVDLTESGDTFDTNEGVDTVLVTRLTDSIALYAERPRPPRPLPLPAVR